MIALASPSAPAASNQPAPPRSDPPYHILVAESLSFPPEAARQLREFGALELHDLNPSQLPEALAAVDVLWIRLRNRINAQVLDAAPRLKIIVSPTTGLNHIDLAETQKRGIRVLSLQGETDFLRTVRATAEHAIGLILALVRQIPAASSHVARDGWNRDLFRGRELYGKTAGIIGYGRLGRIVAQLLNAFEMHVIAHDPAAASEEPSAPVRFLPLPELLQRADLVSLHVNLTPRTTRFFQQEHFHSMKHGAWFINTSRGELIDESALLKALDSGHLAGAALDVLSNEDSSGMGRHPLTQYAQTHSNLIITPHIGGCTLESLQKTEEFLASKLCSLLAQPADDSLRKAIPSLP